MSFELKRRPKSLSYSAVAKYYSDTDEFFLTYLAGNRAPRLPQEDYMAVGSAFDAYVKSTLHSALFGPGSDPKFEFSSIFEEQVEKQNWDFGLRAGKHIWRSYVTSGAYDELLKLLTLSIEPPQFETKIEGIVEGVPFNGKPDLRFRLQLPGFDPVRVILDWKCKGYCSKHGASPSKGYALCRDCYKVPEGKKQSQSHGKEHKQYLSTNFRGLDVNTVYMETCNEDYSQQVSTYGWLLGETPGDETVVVWVDEIVAKYMDGLPPLLRVANHRARVSREYQLKWLDRIKTCWNAIQTGHIFQDISREDSDSRCEVLDSMAVGLQTDGSEEEAFFNECTRSTQFKR